MQAHYHSGFPLTFGVLNKLFCHLLLMRCGLACSLVLPVVPSLPRRLVALAFFFFYWVMSAVVAWKLLSSFSMFCFPILPIG